MNEIKLQHSGLQRLVKLRSRESEKRLSVRDTRDKTVEKFQKFDFIVNSSIRYVRMPEIENYLKLETRLNVRLSRFRLFPISPVRRKDL